MTRDSKIQGLVRCIKFLIEFFMLQERSKAKAEYDKVIFTS